MTKIHEATPEQVSRACAGEAQRLLAHALRCAEDGTRWRTREEREKDNRDIEKAHQLLECAAMLKEQNAILASDERHA